MSEENWLEAVNHRMWIEEIQETNQCTEKYGLRLSKEDAEILIAEKMRS